MAKLSILAGATSVSVNVFVQNSAVTTGAGLTGLAFNTASLIAYYTFAGAPATATVITLATLAAVNSAYSSGGFKEIDATHMPGVYRLDIPNTALAAGNGRSVCIMLSGVANMAPVLLEIALTAVDNQSTSFGLSSVPITSNIKANQALADYPFVMTDSTTHAPKTGLTVTATRSLNGAAFASCANSVVEISNGWYQINLAATDLNANTVALRFTAAAADDRDISIVTQP